MRQWVLWAVLVIGATTSLALAAPLKGPLTLSEHIEAGDVGAGGEIMPRGLAFASDFRGGERACVIVCGDHRPFVPVTVTVYADEKRTRKVAEDSGTEEAPDMVAVVWYPPRDGRYYIVATSQGKLYNELTICLK